MSKSIAILILSLFVISFLCGPLAHAQEEPAKRVLVLNSYNKGFVQTDDIVKGIESVLKAKENDVELGIEYMDSKATKYETQYKDKLYDLYKYKYGNQKFDVIISSDDNALNFLREYHKDLFPGTPIVFCGVNNIDAPNLVDRDVFTGIIELQSVRETIDLGLKLHPGTRQIVFVVDNTPTGVYFWNLVQEMFKYYENIQMIRIDDSLSMEQIEDKVSRLSDDTIMYFGTFHRDKSGKYYSSNEAALRISKASARPMYGHSVQVLPYGIVGGKLFGGFYHGQVAAKMAQRILIGEKVRDIPVLTEPQTQYMFDYEQMERWGIKLSDLPKDSIVINKPYSFYEENKRLVSGIIAVMIFQTLTIVGFVVNTSRRKRAEEALRESERKLFQIVAGSSTPIFVIDKKHTVTHWNKACENLTGVPASEMIGTQKQWSPFHSVERPVMADLIVDEVAEEDAARYYGGKYQKSALIEGAYEAEDFFPGFGNKWLFLTAAPLRDHQGKVIGAIETLQDITERKRAEGALKEYSERLEEMVEERTAQLNERVAQVEQLNQGMTNLLEDLQAANRSLERTTEKLAEVNQELNDFAYVVSHDLKAPLRAVTQLANWIATDYADALDQEGQEMVHLLIGRTKRMHNLIEGILQYSRIGRVKEKEKKVDLNQLAQEAIEMLAPPQDIQVIIEDELPTVVGERTRLGQVFQNLLGNAIKFLGKPEGRVSVGCVDEGSRWLFSVADNGPGIEEKYHARIFQMFQTLAPRDEFESTGVGLALVKKIVEKWEGEIWMESTVGQGSTFFFTLPK